MISIIVTHKQNLSYLHDCLESIAEQKYKDIETILVLDHTEDDLTDIKEEFGESTNLKVYELTDKTGVAAGRNLGLEKAQGDFVMFLDNDDYMIGESLQAMMDEFEEETDFVYPQYKRTYFKREAVLSGLASPYEGEEKELAKVDFNDPVNYNIERYDSIEMPSVLGTIYRKKLFTDNDIKFYEDQPYYADVEVVADIYSVADFMKGAEGALYMQRLHNDKVNNPSLSQYPKDETMPYYFMAYDHLMEVVTNERVRRHYQLILSYYIAQWLPRKHRLSREDKWRGEYYEKLKELALDIDKEIIKRSDMDRISKKFMYVFIKGNEAKIQRAIDRTRFKRKISDMRHDARLRNKNLSLHFFSKLPFKKNWVVFESFMGRSYSGNPKYIYQYMQKHYGNKYKYIWLLNDTRTKIDGKCKKVKRFGMWDFYYRNRSKYWVINMRQPLVIPKRNKTVILSTWHGTPLKRLVFDMDDNYSATPEYKNIVYKQTREWNYLLADNAYSVDKFKNCFQLDDDILFLSGYPANDPMYAQDRDEKAAEIKKKLNIDPDKKVILYAPTWRDNDWIGEGQYDFDLAMDLDRLQKEFSDEYVILMRLHYFIVKGLDLSKYKDFVIDVSQYSDITDLYLVSDMLITDYSSAYFDYGNLKRPILFYMYDLELYKNNLRGFYIDIENDMPGPVFETNDELVYNIKHIDEVKEQYKEKFDKFYDEFCSVDDGNASKRVVEKVFEK